MERLTMVLLQIGVAAALQVSGQQGPGATGPSPSGSGPAFALRSPAVAAGGQLPKDYTGDGSAATLPLEWSGAPEGTRSYAVIMHHIDPEGNAKWYWTLFDIPASVQALARNVTGVGTLGTNSVNGRVGYAPPHSKGPGPKTYIYTVYALSAAPRLSVPPAQVTREALLAAMRGSILATAELRVVYSRPERTTGRQGPETPVQNPNRKVTP